MRWTENATIAQKEVGYAEYPGYQASGSSAVAGGLTTRRGDATRPAHPAVTPRLCQISRVCLSRHPDRSRCGLPCDRSRRRLMEARGLRKPRVFMSCVAMVVSSVGALTQCRTRGRSTPQSPPSPPSPAARPSLATAPTSLGSREGLAAPPSPVRTGTYDFHRIRLQLVTAVCESLVVAHRPVSWLDGPRFADGNTSALIRGWSRRRRRLDQYDVAGVPPR